MLIVISCAFLSADVYIKTNTHTDAFMGQPAKDVVTEQWIGKDKFANVAENQTTIVDLGKKKLFIIYNNTKSYVEADLPLDISKLVPDQMASMMSMMKLTVTVNPTDETKKIDKWNCKAYDINMDMSMMQMKMKAWVTTDVPFDWKSYMEKMFGIIMTSTMPMIDQKSIDEFKKIKGFQVATDMSMAMMGQNVKVSTRVAEITSKPAPANIYSVPAGFKKQDKMTMRGGM
jgi:hypothetical protein